MDVHHLSLHARTNGADTFLELIANPFRSAVSLFWLKRENTTLTSYSLQLLLFGPH
jgi:hypothetical protein